MVHPVVFSTRFCYTPPFPLLAVLACLGRLLQDVVRSSIFSAFLSPETASEHSIRGFKMNQRVQAIQTKGLRATKTSPRSLFDSLANLC